MRFVSWGVLVRAPPAWRASHVCQRFERASPLAAGDARSVYAATEGHEICSCNGRYPGFTPTSPLPVDLHLHDRAHVTERKTTRAHLDPRLPHATRSSPFPSQARSQKAGPPSRCRSATQAGTTAPGRARSRFPSRTACRPDSRRGRDGHIHLPSVLPGRIRGGAVTRGLARPSPGHRGTALDVIPAQMRERGQAPIKHLPALEANQKVYRRSNSPLRMPPTNASHSAERNRRTEPLGFWLSRTWTRSPEGPATSTQLPFAMLSELFIQLSSGPSVRQSAGL